MADLVVIKGVAPYDGSYPFNLEDLTTREWGWIKRHAGYLPASLDDNSWSDPELVAVLAAVMMRRAGKIQTVDVPQLLERFQDAPFGSSITLEFEETPVEEDTENPLEENSNGKPDSSGPGSRTSSATSDETQPLYGIPDSALSQSDRVTSAT